MTRRSVVAGGFSLAGLAVASVGFYLLFGSGATLVIAGVALILFGLVAIDVDVDGGDRG